MPNLRTPNVALILYGQPRFVSTGLAAFTQRRFLRNCNLSIFGHVWYSENVKQMSTSTWSGLKNFELSHDSITSIQKLWPGIELSIEAPRKFEVEVFRGPGNSFKANPKLPLGRNIEENASNTISQLYSINQALQLANKANQHEEFNYYVLTRYDCVIGSFLDPSKWSLDLLYLSSHHDFPDPILIGSPRLVNATDAFLNWSETARGSDVFLTPEEFKKNEFLKHFENSSYLNVNSRVEFLRSNSKFKGIILLYIKMSPVVLLLRRVIGKAKFEFKKLQVSVHTLRF